MKKTMNTTNKTVKTGRASAYITVAEFVKALFFKLIHLLGISLKNLKLHDYCNVYDKDGNKVTYIDKTGKVKDQVEYLDKVGFIIWNILEKGCCPYAGICAKFCYAISTSIRRGHNTIHSRFFNFLETLNPNFVDNMIYTIETRINKGKYKSYDRINIRIHESGDFYSLDYLKSWYEIAKHFESDKRLYFVAYTTSYRAPWYTEIGKPDNMKIIKSGVDYVVVDSLENIPVENQCHCKNCGHADYCNKCYDTNFTGTIYVKKHGSNKDNNKALQNESNQAYNDLILKTRDFVRDYNRYFTDEKGRAFIAGRESETLKMLLDSFQADIFSTETWIDQYKRSTTTADFPIEKAK